MDPPSATQTMPWFLNSIMFDPCFKWEEKTQSIDLLENEKCENESNRF